MKALLINDTSDWYHWGCFGTSKGLRLLLEDRFDEVDRLPITFSSARTVLPARLQGFVRPDFCQRFLSEWPGTPALLDCDVLVINGEGSIHHMSHNVRRMLYIAVIAKKFLGKQVWLVNHSCFPDPDGTLDAETLGIYRLAYGMADFIAVRESLSVSELQKLGVWDVQLAFDCLPVALTRQREAQASALRDVLCFAGTSGPFEWGYEQAARMFTEFQRLAIDVVWPVGAPANEARDEARLRDAIHADGFAFERVDVTSLQDWADIIQNARHAVLGRFHHSICRLWHTSNMLVYGGNTQKTEAYLLDLGLAESYVRTPGALDLARYLKQDRVEIEGTIRQTLLERASRNVP